MYSKVIQLYIYTYIYMYISFFRLFSIVGYFIRYWVQLPVLYSRSLLFTYFTYSSVYMLNPKLLTYLSLTKKYTFLSSTSDLLSQNFCILANSPDDFMSTKVWKVLGKRVYEFMEWEGIYWKERKFSHWRIPLGAEKQKKQTNKRPLPSEPRWRNRRTCSHSLLREHQNHN